VRAVGSVPQNEGQNRTVWAARHHGGIRAAMLLPGATDGEVFRIFVERVLRPELKPGDAVMWDNLGAHQVAGVAELLQTAGVSWYYRPPYSPDDNPREEAWSKSKTWLRAAGARTRAQRQRAREGARAQVSAQDSRAWFKHGGYPLH
jgi:transposase